MQRRLFTGALLAAPWQIHAKTDALEDRLRAGACAVLLRHAQTDSGTGDPPGFQLDQCSTQRNLSDEGRAQAGRIGQWFELHGLKPDAVRSSAWCRCRHTADLAFGQHAVWPALNSFFETEDTQAAQTTQLRAALALIQADKFQVWVTHQVNITALTGETVAMGEALVLDATGQLFARRRFGAAN